MTPLYLYKNPCELMLPIYQISIKTVLIFWLKTNHCHNYQRMGLFIL